MQTHSELFQKILQHAQDKHLFEKRSLQALQWYKRKVREVYGSTTLVPTKGVYKSVRPSFAVGSMYTYKYNPKCKETLPYYDIYPLVLILKRISGGFLGLNLHYISPSNRALFMDKLYNYVVFRKHMNGSIINIKYKTLKMSMNMNLGFYRPCLKRYLFTNIRTRLYFINPHEWDIALFLPTERFIKEPKEYVWKQSRRLV